MQDAEELLDLVDENDNVIDTVFRHDYYKNWGNNKGYLRAVELVIQNDKGELWIPRRTMDRKIAPGGLDYSSAGHVDAGENYRSAIIRETEEELNLTLEESDIKLLKMLRPNNELPYHRAIYLYKSNDVPKYNPEDFQEYFWLQPTELIDWIKSGEPAKTSIVPTITAVLDQL